MNRVDVWVLGFVETARPVQGLMSVFEIDEATAKSLAEKAPVAVKRNLSVGDATVFLRALNGIGARVELRAPEPPPRPSQPEPQRVSLPHPSEPPAPPAPVPASVPQSAPQAPSYSFGELELGDAPPPIDLMGNAGDPGIDLMGNAPQAPGIDMMGQGGPSQAPGIDLGTDLEGFGAPAPSIDLDSLDDPGGFGSEQQPPAQGMDFGAVALPEDDELPSLPDDLVPEHQPPPRRPRPQRIERPERPSQGGYPGVPESNSPRRGLGQVVDADKERKELMARLIPAGIAVVVGIVVLAVGLAMGRSCFLGTGSLFSLAADGSGLASVVLGTIFLVNAGIMGGSGTFSITPGAAGLVLGYAAAFGINYLQEPSPEELAEMAEAEIQAELSAAPSARDWLRTDGNTIGFLNPGQSRALVNRLLSAGGREAKALDCDGNTCSTLAVRVPSSRASRLALGNAAWRLIQTEAQREGLVRGDFTVPAGDAWWYLDLSSD